MSAHQLPQYYQLQMIPSTAGAISITWYMCYKIILVRLYLKRLTLCHLLLMQRGWYIHICILFQHSDFHLSNDFFTIIYLTKITFPVSPSPKIFSLRTKIDTSLIGIILRWGFLIWELIFIYCGLFSHLVSFCVVSSFTTIRANFTSGLLQVILPRPQIGMLSLVTISPVITAFDSCCLSHHVFDQVNLRPAWVEFETAITWQCSPETVETQRLYPLHHGPCWHVVRI